MNDTECKPGVDKAFLNVLGNHRSGVIITDTSVALKQATAAVQLTGKPAKVILTMILRPASAGSVGTLVFEPRIRTVIPESVPAGSIFYANADFDLVRNDPGQASLELREVITAPAATELKEVV